MFVKGFSKPSLSVLLANRPVNAPGFSALSIVVHSLFAFVLSLIIPLITFYFIMNIKQNDSGDGTIKLLPSARSKVTSKSLMSPLLSREVFKFLIVFSFKQELRSWFVISSFSYQIA